MINNLPYEVGTKIICDGQDWKFEGRVDGYVTGGVNIVVTKLLPLHNDPDVQVGQEFMFTHEKLCDFLDGPAWRVVSDPSPRISDPTFGVFG